MLSLVIFSVEVDRLADFYSTLLGANLTSEEHGVVRVHCGETILRILSIPGEIAHDIVITTPPQGRDDVAVKPIFEVENLALSLQSISALGGVDTGRSFSDSDFDYHDVLDPEGNVIQLSWRTPTNLKI